jgi:hypothetical protein
VSIHGLKDTIGDTGCPEKTDFCEDLLTNERGSPNIYGLYTPGIYTTESIFSIKWGNVGKGKFFIFAKLLIGVFDILLILLIGLKGIIF